jgi:dTDP-4-amino-4,6-dideoxygalactose transaminase
MPGFVKFMTREAIPLFTACDTLTLKGLMSTPSTLSSSSLALLGGSPVRTTPWPAWPQHGPAVLNAIHRVALSQNYHPQFGKETEALESLFATYHRLPHAVGTSSGTTALQLALAAAGIGHGDEVIVPAYTYIASASCVVEQNAIPVFADSEPLSQGLDPADVRRKISPRTRAIIAVHCNGYPCNMDALMAIAAEHHLIVIEDGSHAHGASYKGRKVGTIGHVGAFSLQHKKNLSAGMGGIAITRDPEIARKMKAWRTFTYDERVGHNWLMSEFHAAIAAALVPHIDTMNEQRRANVSTLLEALGPIEGITPLPGLPETAPAYYNLILQYDEARVGLPRAIFIQALKAEGIPFNMFYTPLQRWGVFARADYYGRGCPFSTQPDGTPASYASVSTPVADAICDRINLEIKVQPTSGATEMVQIATAIRKIHNHRHLLAAPSNLPINRNTT